MLWNIISKFLGPLAFILVLLFAIDKCNDAREAKKMSQTHSKRIETAINIIDKYTDSSGNEHSVYKPHLVSSEELSREVDSSLTSLIDTVSDELKIAKNTIVELRRENAYFKAKMKGTKVDTLIVYKDNTVDWKFNPYDNVLDLSVNLIPSSVSYTDGKRFLGFTIGAQNIYTNTWWNDHRIKINSIDHIIVKQPIPKNNIKLSAKSEYRLVRDELLVGPSAEIILNRFGLEGSYLYNYKNKNYETVLGLKYYVIK